MSFDKIDTSAKHYAVLDVETNGLRSKEHDLLSISIYKPDDNKLYNRFLPLELNKIIPKHTLKNNGITIKDVKNKNPLTQNEVDRLFDEYELDKRILLHYGNLDKTFLKSYFKRHKLYGFSRLKFYNFKSLICSSRFFNGELSKDNLCKMFRIENVTDVHSGKNDCKLEWQLFEKIQGRPLLATEGDGWINLFVLNEDYMIPVSLLDTHTRLRKYLTLPEIECDFQQIYELTISDDTIERFDGNITGVTIEHLINSMLNITKNDSKEFTLKNKCKLEYLGRIKSTQEYMRVLFDDDGTITAVDEEDEKTVERINETLMKIKTQIKPLITFIKQEIFNGEEIFSQEVSIDSEHDIFALCDLSSKSAILEIKTNFGSPYQYKEQLYYEAMGRKAYIMGMEWNRNLSNGKLESIKIVIKEVYLKITEKGDYGKK